MLFSESPVLTTIVPDAPPDACPVPRYTDPVVPLNVVPVDSSILPDGLPATLPDAM